MKTQTHYHGPVNYWPARLMAFAALWLLAMWILAGVSGCNKLSAHQGGEFSSSSYTNSNHGALQFEKSPTKSEEGLRFSPPDEGASPSTSDVSY